MRGTYSRANQNQEGHQCMRDFVQTFNSMFCFSSLSSLFCLDGVVVKQCLENLQGHDYVGTENTTESGLPCQRWDSQAPHEHTWGKLGMDENYCRNAGNKEKLPWCYTNSPDKRWEYCNISFCGNVFLLITVSNLFQINKTFLTVIGVLYSLLHTDVLINVHFQTICFTACCRTLGLNSIN